MPLSASTQLKCLRQGAQPRGPQLTEAQATILGALNLRTITLSPFPCSILYFPLIAHPVSNNPKRLH
jgi:hypothetical protein